MLEVVAQSMFQYLLGFQIHPILQCRYRLKFRSQDRSQRSRSVHLYSHCSQKYPRYLRIKNSFTIFRLGYFFSRSRNLISHFWKILFDIAKKPIEINHFCKGHINSKTIGHIWSSFWKFWLIIMVSVVKKPSKTQFWKRHRNGSKMEFKPIKGH